MATTKEEFWKGSEKMKKKLLSLLLAAAMMCSMIPTAFAASNEAIDAANALHDRGLFSGVGTNADGTPNFDLDRTPTRHEAVTMLVAILGKTSEAQNGSWTTPFTDVVDWAKPYVGYAYTNGLTSGTSATTYSGNLPVSATQYLTFVLTALGYKNGVDFQWDKAWELSDKLGITNGQYNATTAFTRGDVAIISYNALSAEKKDPQENTQQNVQPEVTENAIDLQGYWMSDTTEASGNRYVEYYHFDGNKYTYSERCYGSTNKATLTMCSEGTFTFYDGVLTLTRTSFYSRMHNTGTASSNTETDIIERQLTRVGDGIDFGKDGVFVRADQAQAEAAHNEHRDYAMQQTTSVNSADYAYLAGTVFRGIRDDYPHAVAQCAYVYAYTDLNGDLCVLTDVRFKIISNYNGFTLFNVTQGTRINNPDDYYSDLANRYYGANKLHYMELSSEVSGHYFKMLSAMSSILSGGANTYGGVYVDAATLNQ